MRCRMWCSFALPIHFWSRSGTADMLRVFRSPWQRISAYRDVVQNHLLQLLCNIAMEPPPNTEIERVRDEKVKVLRSMRTLTAKDVVRGQFEGYRDEPGVKK